MPIGIALIDCEEKILHKSKTLDRSFRSIDWFVLLLVLVLSIAVLVLVLEAISYRNPARWSLSYREPLRSTIGIAAVQTAIEYEYRFTEYRFAEYEYEYEYEEIQSEARSSYIPDRVYQPPERASATVSKLCFIMPK
jgi:hypothetical protein